MARNIKYYDISNVLKTEAQYIILLGQRSNGKSYQAKLTVLKNAYKNKKNFVYLRRWQADIKTKAIKSYFADMPISKITNGEYSGIEAWNGDIYFTTVDDKGNTIKGQTIGKYCALNEYERYKSWAFVDYEYILFEEFITDATYLNDEPRQLQQFVSTVARHKKLTVLMIGNTLSRVCPYFNEWCLEGVLKQKIGTIDVYHHHLENSVVDIAVEYCANSNAENKMFFGQSAKQIVSGEWDTVDVPKLPKPIEYYDKVYEVLVEYQNFKFVINLLVDSNKGGKICYVYPYTKQRKIMRILTDVFSDSPFISSRLDITRIAERYIVECFRLNKVCYSDNPFISSRLDITRTAERYIVECFRLNKVCYSDNLTGADFKHVIDVFKIM